MAPRKAAATKRDTSAPPEREDAPKIGGYKADYTPLTPQEIVQPDHESDELFKNSEPVP